jgi:hypothetical protein
MPLAQAADNGKRKGRLIEILSLYALALQASGRQEEAQIILASLGGRARRVFLDEGEPMIRLLKQLQTSKSAPRLKGYVNLLLEAGAPATNESI